MYVSILVFCKYFPKVNVLNCHSNLIKLVVNASNIRAFFNVYIYLSLCPYNLVLIGHNKKINILLLYSVCFGSNPGMCVLLRWQRVGAVLNCEMNHGGVQEGSH